MKTNLVEFAADAHDPLRHFLCQFAKAVCDAGVRIKFDSIEISTGYFQSILQFEIDAKQSVAKSP